jgi:hypothetical protein
MTKSEELQNRLSKLLDETKAIFKIGSMVDIALADFNKSISGTVHGVTIKHGKLKVNVILITT